jgi:hypothetical protein
LTRSQNTLAVLIALLVGMGSVAIFGSTWGEEMNHAWYSAGATTGLNSLVPFEANNFGKVLFLGNPVYDFSIAAGSRLPLQVGIGGTPFLLLRHVLSLELIVVVVVTLLLTLALLLFGHLLSTFGLNSFSVRTGLYLSFIAIPTFHLTEHDWYSLAAGFVCMAVVVMLGVLLLVAGENRSKYKQHRKYFQLGLVALFIGLPSSYVSYYHLCLVAAATALMIGRKRLVHEMRRIAGKSWFLAPVAVVSAATVLLLLWDIHLAGTAQSLSDRNTAPTTLLSPWGGINQVKHFSLQVVIGDWRGLATALNDRVVTSYASATVPVTLYASSSLCFFALQRLSVCRRRDVTLCGRAENFLCTIIALSVVLLWAPLFPADLDVSNKNFFAHLGTVGSLLLIGRTASGPRVSPRASTRGGQVVTLIKRFFLVMFVLNSLLVVPNAILTTIDNRALLIAPNSLFRIASGEFINEDQTAVQQDVLRQRRVFSFTEDFDAQKYFQPELRGYVTYGDLTQNLIATVNSYPKIRDATNISRGSRYSSSLAPSSMNIATGKYCPIDAVKFLGVATLVLTVEQLHQCRTSTTELRSRSVEFIGVRDKKVMLSVQLPDSPTFWALKGDSGEKPCPIIESECWARLHWHENRKIRARVLLSKPNENRAPLRITLSSSDSAEGRLVIPVAYDEQLRVAATAGLETVRLPVSAVNGFAAVNIPHDDQTLELQVSVVPDLRMFLYGVLPYCWIVAALLALTLRWQQIRRVRGVISVGA